MPEAVHARRNLFDFRFSYASLQSLSSLSSLELLEMGDNRISQLAGLDSLQSLRELWLGRNRVTSISDLGRSARGLPALLCRQMSVMQSVLQQHAPKHVIQQST